MNSAPSFKQPSAYGQLMALPENVIGEILNGQLHTQPRPSGLHGTAEGVLSAELLMPFQLGRNGPGGWWIIAEPEVHFIRDIEVAVPDLAGWRREMMPTIPTGHRFEVVPDWVCEILSPSTAKKDRIVKLPLYARYGVAYVWLIDPIQRTLEAYQLQANLWVLIAALQDDAMVCIPPFDATEFPLQGLWA
jgi:Uma2 family endonuclease